MAKDEKVVVRLDAEMLVELDKLRREYPDLPSRAETFRRLLMKATAELKAEAKPKPPKKKPGS